MKVLHVIPSLAKRYGGPSTAIIPMVSVLDNIGVAVSIAATDADGPENYISPIPIDDSIPLHYFRRDFSETWKVSFQLRKWLKWNVQNYDLVHIHALWTFSSAVAARSCIVSSIPYVLRPAGMLSSYSWKNKGWKKRLYWKFLEKKTIDNATAFHATSEGEKADIQRVRPSANVYVIPNGVEDSAFTYAPDYDKKKLKKDIGVGDDPIILFLSRLHPKKGIVDRLLPAMAQLNKTAQLLIVGGEDGHYPGYQSEIEATIHKLDLHGCVKVSKAAEGDKRWDYFDLADLFVLPSHSENFGIVVAEAMARGCPVITTEDVQSAPLVVQAKAGVIIKGEVNELAGAMDQLLNDAEARHSMGVSGQQFAQENLRWDMVGEQIAAMYEDVLAYRLSDER